MAHRLRSKLTSDVESLIHDVDGERVVEVVIELDAPRGDMDIAELKASFSRLARPVAEHIARLGGEITGEAWINQTLKARLPAERIPQLSHLAHVGTVDVPHRITLD